MLVRALLSHRLQVRAVPATVAVCLAQRTHQLGDDAVGKLAGAQLAEVLGVLGDRLPGVRDGRAVRYCGHSGSSSIGISRACGSPS